MIWLLLATLMIFSNPGEEVRLNLTDSAELRVDDQCIFFKETLNSSANLPPGLHELVIGFNCTPGDKMVFANDWPYAIIRVGNLNSLALDNASKIQIELLKTKKELNSTFEKLQKIKEELNSSLSRIEKLEREKRLLEIELTLLNDSYRDLSAKYERLSRELEVKRLRISEMEDEIRALSELSSTYRATTLFLVSIFIGSFTATYLMSRKI